MKKPAQNLVPTVVRKALQDATFRRNLMANSKAAIRSLGVSLPEGVEIKVVEETPSRWYLVLPAPGGSEIPDEQLDAVAGGLGYPTGLSAYAVTLNKVAAGGVPGSPLGAGGVPGSPLGAGGVPGSPLGAGGVPG